MYKKLLVASAVLGLTACGSEDNSEDVSPKTTPAVITGTTEATLSNIDTDVSYFLNITDNDADESAFIVMDNKATTYGIFSLTSEGKWTYSLDKTNSAVVNLTLGETLTESITVNSIDGTPQTILLTITMDAEDVTTPLIGSPGDNDTVPAVSCTDTFDSISDLTDAASYNIAAGTTLCLQDGIYNDDFELSFGGNGTEASPITIAAENPGNVIIQNSEVSIQMSGEYVTLQGFIFRDGALDNNIIVTRGNGSIPCNHCRITEVSVIDMDDGINNTDDTTKWVEIYGQYNRIDHSWFSGKTSRGALLIVDRYSDEDDFDEDTFEVDYAQIDHNYFGNRPPIEGKAYAGSSDNEYEGIRIGLSTTHSGNSYSVVERNFFERIQGEAEVISNKASNNTIQYNTIRESNGSIVTRHGHNTTIANNFIISDDYPFTGGIRLVDDGHTVTNNYIEGARYENSSWNGGIVLTGGDGSGDADNGYQDVENVFIAHNTIVDSVNSLNVFGGKESTVPNNVYFINNIIADALGPVIKSGEDMPETATFAGNYVYGQAFSDDDSLTSLTGMTEVDAALEKDAHGIYRPSDASPSLSADSNVDTGDFSLPSNDMDGQTRSDDTLSGADEVLGSDVSTGLLTADLVGPKSYRPAPGKTYVEKVDIVNHDFDEGDLTGWDNTNVTIETDDYFSRGISALLEVDSTLTQQLTISANTNYTLSAFTKGVASIYATLDGETYSTDLNSSDYKFNSVSFNSGSATSVTIGASVDQFVDSDAIVDGDFTDFRGGDTSNWSVTEGTTEGDVSSSSNSASGSDGSVKLGYTTPEHENSTPSIAQTFTVESNADIAFSLAMLVKNNSESTATLRVEGDDSVLINDLTLDYDDLEDVDLDDSFNLYSDTLNSGNNTQLTVSITFDGHAINGDKTAGSDGKLSSTVQKMNEIRIDNISLITQGAPAEGTQALVDSVRLVAY